MEYGCIGEKLAHSFSKIIHNKLANYSYELMEIPKDKLGEFMEKAQFKAINVTIPYKQDVIPYLDVISQRAEEIGAVNTIVNKSGVLYGYNTDFYGMRDLIKRADIELKGKKVLILGSGGTSKTALAVARNMEASEIYRVSRRETEGLLTYEKAKEEHSDAGIIINTTPCGMYPNIGKSAVDIEDFPCLCGVIDAVYNPLNSHLVVNAKNRGIKAVGGLYMLVSQAVYAAEKFTGEKIPQNKTLEVYNEILLSKRNIVLIGMPGCGKSTIGKMLAEDMGRNFTDTDTLIVQKEKIPITEIFARKGEEAFRKTESEIIAEVSASQGTVIATGGGAVLDGRNTELLRENGTVVFIDRPLEYITATSDRPLSSDRELLEKRYKERYGIYCAAADIHVKAVGNIEQNAEKIKEAFRNANIGY